MSYEHLKVITHLNHIQVLKVQLVGALSKLMVVVMKVVGYTSCKLVHNYCSGILYYLYHYTKNKI